jgi:hypothetical protein
MIMRSTDKEKEPGGINPATETLRITDQDSSSCAKRSGQVREAFASKKKTKGKVSYPLPYDSLLSI